MPARMDADAFVVLEAVARGVRADGPDSDRWIEAFKTIRWVVEGLDGPMLTAEGRRARDEMALERRGKPSQRRPAPEPQQRRAALG